MVRITRAADRVEGVREAASIRRRPVELPPVRRQRNVRVEGVRAARVILAKMPVKVPDPVAPANQLTHEALDAVQRSPPGVVFGHGTLDDLKRVQQAEVHRHAQTCVGHGVVAEHHGVFVRPEVVESGLDEVVEGGERLSPRRRELARPVAPEKVDAVGFESIEFGAHLDINVIFNGQPRSGQPERDGTLRRRLSVVGVEAELATLGPRGRHKQASALAHFAVEAIHDQLCRLAACGPGGELFFVRHEPPRRQDACAELAHQVPRSPRRRVDRLEVLVCQPGILQRRAVTARLDVRAPVTQLARTVPQRREVEVRLLPMGGAAAKHRCVLDEHDRPAVVERGAELPGG